MRRQGQEIRPTLQSISIEALSTINEYRLAVLALFGDANDHARVASLVFAAIFGQCRSFDCASAADTTTNWVCQTGQSGYRETLASVSAERDVRQYTHAALTSWSCHRNQLARSLRVFEAFPHVPVPKKIASSSLPILFYLPLTISSSPFVFA